jgi:hypothetical protein
MKATEIEPPAILCARCSEMDTYQSSINDNDTQQAREEEPRQNNITFPEYVRLLQENKQLKLEV